MSRALFVGRFQPPHRGHLAVIRDLASRHDGVIIGIGSAFDSHSSRNPFTSGERFRMLEEACRDEGITNAVIVPIPDLNRNALWVHHVRSILPPFDVFVSNNPLPRRLFSEAGVKVERMPLLDRDSLEGSKVRAALLAGAGWEDSVPPSVARILHEIGAVSRVKDLAESDASTA